MPEPSRVTPDEVKTRMDGGERLTSIDARNTKAWAEAGTMVPHAIRVPADKVDEHLHEIPRDRAVIAYCT